MVTKIPPNSSAPSAEGHRGISQALPCRLVHESDDCLIGVYKDISIVIWRGTATAATVDRLDAMAQARESTRSKRSSSIHVILDGIAPPSEEVRLRLAALTERSAHRLACSVTVLEGAGFWVSSMRSMVAGFHSIKEREFKSHFCSSLEEAAEWLPEPHAEATSTVIERSALLRVLKGVRASA